MEFCGESLWSSASLLHLEHKNLEKTISEHLQNFVTIKKISLEHVEIKCQLDATDDVYCRSYCLFNMFQAPLCPSSGAREYYTDGRCLWYLVLWSLQTGNITISSTTYRQLENQSTKYHRQQPSV